MHITEALAEFLLQLDADGRSAHTRNQYKRHVGLLAHWLAASGNEPNLEAIGNREVAQFLASDHVRLRADGRPRKPTSANTVRSSMRTFFGFAQAAGFVQINAARLVRRARCEPGPPRALSTAEQERLLVALDATITDAGRRDRVLFRLMLATGVRLGEALHVMIEDVALDEGEMRLRFQKGGGEGLVFLAQATVDLLREFIGERAIGWLFPGHGTGPLNHRQAHRRLSLHLKAAQVTRKASPHTLRRSFATDLYRRTGDLLLVKEALRHRSITSTMTYARCDGGRLREAVGTWGSQVSSGKLLS